MKHKFSKRKANYVCYMLVISIIIGFLFNLPETIVYGYDERPAVVTGVLQNSYLNMRADAGTGYNIVVSIPYNATLTVIGEKYAADGSLWYNVKYVNATGDEPEHRTCKCESFSIVRDWLALPWQLSRCRADCAPPS